MISLRRTLSVRFAITNFLALLVIAVWAYLGAQRILRRELDRGLLAAAHLEAAAVAADLLIAPQTGFADREAFVELVNRFVVVRDPTGRVLAVNTQFADALPLDPEAFERARAGEVGWGTVETSTEGLRSVFLRVSGTPAADAIVQVAASLEPMEAVSRTVLLLMLATVLLGLVATMFGAAWLARSAVLPVADIAAQADAIRPGEVGQRITAHAGVSEFNGMVRVLNQMLERLDGGVLAQRRIIADVSHDFRTPIAAMQGEIEVALRRERPVQQYRAILSSLLEDVNHLSSINETLLTLARIEAGELSPSVAPTDAAALLHDAADRIRPRAGGRMLTVSLELPPRSIVAVDRRLIGLLLDQLLDNAVRHTPEETRIALTAAVRANEVLIVVEDDGPGVPGDVLPHLFERFYRMDAARGRQAGAGLGLTVSAAIVSAHGGVLRATAAPQGGLRIEVRVPAAGPGSPARQPLREPDPSAVTGRAI